MINPYLNNYFMFKLMIKKYKKCLVCLPVLITLFLANISLINGKQNIILNETNHVVLRGEVSSESISRLIIEINNLSNTTNHIYLYISSNGGSVSDGQSLIQYMEAISSRTNISCIADVALSMGFAILQHCKNRYIMDNSVLMQHQISLSDYSGPIENLENHMKLIKMMYEQLLITQAKRLKMHEEKLRKLISNDWWLYGKNAIDEKAADEIVSVSCDPILTSQYLDIKTQAKHSQLGLIPVTIVYSKCAMIREPIKIIYPNNTGYDILIENESIIKKHKLDFKW